MLERQQQTDNEVELGTSVLCGHTSLEEYKVLKKKKTNPNISNSVLEESEWSIVISCLSNNARNSVSVIYRGYTKGHIMVLNFVKVISTHLLLRKSVN